LLDRGFPENGVFHRPTFLDPAEIIRGREPADAREEADNSPGHPLNTGGEGSEPCGYAFRAPTRRRTQSFEPVRECAGRRTSGPLDRRAAIGQAVSTTTYERSSHPSARRPAY
jgi:hypothetical protein